MSNRALRNLKNNFEIEFLKKCSYKQINKMMNQLYDEIKKLEAENRSLREPAHKDDDDYYKYMSQSGNPQGLSATMKREED